MPTLAIIQLDDYRSQDLKAGFQAAFAELGLARDFKLADKIIIKPNMLSGLAADRAVTSHPEVFRALCGSLRELGAALSFGDSPALDSPEKAAQASGLLDVAGECGVPLADFVNAVDMPLPMGKVMRQIPLARGVAEADGLVSLGKLKTHALTGMTGAIKNQFGVIPGQRKAAYHVAYPVLEDFCQMLVDINLLVRPRLYVVDAIVAMEGNGPRNGHPRKIGAVLLSRDPAAVDAAGSLLMGMDPAHIVTSRLAVQAGLGTMDLALIDACLIRPVGGTASVTQGKADTLLCALQVKDFIRGRVVSGLFTRATTLSAPVFKRYIMRRPKIGEKLCTRCGVCSGACPVSPKALVQSSEGVLPVFNYKLCIRCYCCQETCPAGAIEVQTMPIGRILKV